MHMLYLRGVIKTPGLKGFLQNTFAASAPCGEICFNRLSKKEKKPTTSQNNVN